MPKTVPPTSELSREALDLLIRRLRPGEGAPAPTRIPRRPAGLDAAPLTPGQERLWFLHRLDPGAAAYNLAARVRLAGALDEAALEGALQEILRRHESLRSVITEGEDGAAVQRPTPVPAPPQALIAPRVDLGRLRAEAAHREARRLARSEARRPFDLARGPLLRALLVRLGGDGRGGQLHDLLLTLHHIVSDGASIGIFVRELSALYGAFSAGRPSPLSGPALQFGDYAAWRRERVAPEHLAESLAGDLAFWEERLAGLEPLELPADRSRPPRPSGRGSALPFSLPAALARSVAELARGAGATPFMVLLAAFQVVLARHAATDDVAVGSVVAGRNAPGTEDLIGFFVNTLVLRTDLAGAGSFLDALGRTRRTVVEALEHQELPFSTLVERAARRGAEGAGADGSASPFFRVVFSMDERPRGAFALGALGAEIEEIHTGTAKFDLAVSLTGGGDGLEGAVEYATDLFDRTTAGRLWASYVALLSAALAEPDRLLDELPVMTAAERQQVLVEWGGEVAPYPREATLVGLFDEVAARAPEALALELGGEALSYGELAARSRRLADRLTICLAGPGPGPGEARAAVVALCLPRSLEQVVATLAVLRSGAAYLPLDPEHPAPRLAFMLEDSGAAVLVTRSDAGPAARGLAEGAQGADGAERACEVLWLDRPDDQAVARAVRPAGPVGAEAPAQVIYTSGSTGRPKGVVIPHRALVRLVRGSDLVALGLGDRVAQAANTSFDAASWETWSALANGACLVGLEREVVLSPRALERELSARRISACLLTTSVFNQVAREAPGAFGPLDFVSFGGEAADPAAVARVLEVSSREGAVPAGVVNLYGPTENGVVSTSHRVRRPGEAAHSVPIGRPLANGSARVVDRRLRAVPIGGTGELVLGGDGLASGYRGRPAATAAVFVPDPIAGPVPAGSAPRSGPGARVYRTGDLARWSAAGNLEFGGRIDRQVKVRGVRIEMGEVEAAVASHPAVDTAVVLVRDDRPGDLRLVACVVPREGAPVTPAELRRHAAGRLLSAMVPGAFVLLDRLPLDPHGKVNRRALAALAETAPEQLPTPAGEPTAPRSPVEAIVARAFAEVLGLEPSRVSREDGFFDLGGHSLLATRLAWSLERDLGLEIPLRLLFENPTVAGLAGALEEADELARRPGDEPERDAAIPHLAGDGPFPLSFAQRRLWFLDRYEPGSPQYHVPGGLRLRGELDPGALAGALTAVVRRHRVLRSRFEEHGGEPVQVVVPPGPVPLPVIDLRRLAAPVREAEVARVGRTAARRAFDLSRPPLLRAHLLRLGPGDHALVVNLHHIAADGWSIGVLASELAAFYGLGAAPGRASAELPIQYADYAAWERRRGDAEGALASEVDFWKERLAGLPPLELPGDRPRPAERSGRGEQLQVVVPPALTATARRLAREEGATLFAVLLSVFEVLAGRASGQDELALGTVVAHRARPETEGLIGFFVNTLVLRGDLGDRPSSRELVARSRSRLLEAFEHQELPFERLVEELGVARDASRTPLVQVLFALLNTAPRFELPGLSVEPFPVTTGTAKVDLSINLLEDGEALSGALEYSVDLFDRTTVERLWRRYLGLLEAATAAPDLPAAALPVVSRAERQQILVEWADTESRYPRGASIADGVPDLVSDLVPDLVSDLVTTQARLRPDAVALVSGGSCLTYAELDRRSNRLARRLRGLGIDEETGVGLLLGRSMGMVVATLAVLKAGAYYVPLDPGYPEERLAFMLDDTAAPVVVAEPSLSGHLDRWRESGAWRGEGVVLDPDGGRGRGEEAAPRRTAGPENLAYVMYTSGSTGRPKGVAVASRSIVRLVREPRYAHLGAEETFLQVSPTPFDASTFEIWGALANGARLALMDAGPLDLPELARFLSEQRVSTAFLTSGLFHRMVEEHPRELAGVGRVLTGGEVISPAHVARLLDRGPTQDRARLSHVYGPTENTTFTTYLRLESGDPVPAPLPIGWPIVATRTLVADRELRLAPAGVPGELLAAGDGLARGYLRRPGRTALSFVPHPEPGAPGERVYRTGDLVRWSAGGPIDFLGRIDHQVKIRGFRIEPGEVESVLAGHPGLARAVVVVRRDAGGDKRLVAYALPVPADGPAAVPTVAELRAYLEERLPPYLVPSALLLLDHLPLDPNGKVDRRALPEPPDRPETATYAPPRSPVEEIVAQAFAEVLGVEKVGIHDDFFARGGHSLKATQLVSRLREALQAEIPLRRLFDHPTVAALAESITLEAAGEEAPPALVPEPGEGPRPLSYGQERLWILDRFEPGSSAYTIPLSTRIRGRLDLAAFARALAGVVARHGTLRTTFRSEGGRPAQEVGPVPRPSLPVVDLQGLSAGRREAALGRALDDASLAPFDLAKGPPLRAMLVREGPERAVFHAALHHIVSDGWSLGVFIRELAALYRGEMEGRSAAAELPALPIQYTDYALWQRRWLTGAVRERQLAYWRERLAGVAQGVELPLDRPRPALRSFRGGHREARIEPELAGRLRELATSSGSSLFMVLLAGFDLLLSRLSGERDVVVGSPVAGRGRRELEGLIGIFLNTLVLRTDLSGSPSFRELVGRVRETALGAYGHQDVPFEMLLDALKPERDLSRTPWFQVFFNMLELPLSETARLPGVTLETVSGGELPSKFDLTLYLGPGEEGAVELQAVYNADLFDPRTIERVLEQYRAVLVQAAAEPGRPVDAVSLLLPGDRPFLPDPSEPLDGTWHGPIHEALSRAAEAAPDRAAVVAGGAVWSYGWLEAASNRLAHRLLALGVGRGDRVAIYAQRSASLAVAVLGVLEAGGAFVILDPSYPPRRLAETVAAAAPRVWLELEEAGGVGEELEAALAGAGCARLTLPAGAPERAFAGEPESAPAVRVGPDDPAYVAFTSGSTGRPKGIVGRHGSLTHFLPWQCERFGLVADDRFCLLSGLAHDPLQRDIFTPLWLGGALVVPDPRDVGTPGRLARWLARERVTVAHLTPAMGQILSEQPRSERARAPGARVDSLRYALLVGDALTRRDVARLRRLAPRVSVVNLYGSTETQRAVAFHEAGPAELGTDAAPGRSREVLPLGRGMRGAQLLVLDPAGRLAGIGEAGEIAVRSPHLALGYLGDDALTAERFIRNPFGRAPEDRLYRTGDLGRYRGDGEVLFLGRADDQVKVRGFRIELGEVVAHLARAPGVREAAVLPRSDGPLGQRLAAYVVPDPKHPLEADALRRHLRRSLPAYMVPASFVVLDALPLTPNRKLDRRALLAMDDRSREDAVPRGETPNTETERVLAGIVQEVLGRERVGVDENFFDLGGNSLLLVQVHAKLEESFGREIAVVELFNHPTVRDLARFLGDGVGPGGGPGGGREPEADRTPDHRTEQVLKGKDRLQRRRRQKAG